MAAAARQIFLVTKFPPPPRWLVIVEDTVDREQPVMLPIDSAQLGREGLGCSVGADRQHRGVLVLRGDGRPAENLRGGCVEDAGWNRQILDNLEESESTHGHSFHGGLGDLEAQADVPLASEVIDFVGSHLGEDATKGRGILEIAVIQEECLRVDPEF